ncbi:MAG: hypothetical protein ACLU4N_17755 [Butyricimonas faecihominis]
MYVEEQAILDATNGGLDILYYYPQAGKRWKHGKKGLKFGMNELHQS